MLFCFCDLDLDPMTLVYKLDLDILKISIYISIYPRYLHSNTEPSTCFISSSKEVQNSTVCWETHGDHFLWVSKGLLLIDYLPHKTTMTTLVCC